MYKTDEFHFFTFSVTLFSKIFCVNGNTGFNLESRVFLFRQICKMTKIMKEKDQVVPDEVLSKEFFS